MDVSAELFHVKRNTYNFIILVKIIVPVCLYILEKQILTMFQYYIWNDFGGSKKYDVE
jgi:hypothetical protein